ncbi:MAG: hypothetical protein K2H22_02765 [Muribaculaceae bacterium]|nr:hypothetical protein [Muribaculaceae bacterium]
MESFDWNALIATLPTAVVAIVAIVYSNIGNRHSQSTSIMLDFSRRYQDIILAMPEDEARQDRYILLYFDLCSEEYRLYQKSKQNRKKILHKIFRTGNAPVDETTWDLWEDGMRNLMKNNATYRQVWKENRKDYASDSFQSFFDEIVATAENE